MPFWRRYIVVDHEEYGLVWSFVLIDMSKTHSNVIRLYFITKSKQPGHTFVSAVMCRGMRVNVYAYPGFANTVRVKQSFYICKTLHTPTRFLLLLSFLFFYVFLCICSTHAYEELLMEQKGLSCI